MVKHFMTDDIRINLFVFIHVTCVIATINFTVEHSVVHVLKQIIYHNTPANDQKECSYYALDQHHQGLPCVFHYPKKSIPVDL